MSASPTHDGDQDAGNGRDQDPGARDEGGRVEHSERLFGVNLESTSLVVTAAVVSVLLAVAILTLGIPWLAGVIAVVMLAFAALDVREILHQLGQFRPGSAAVAIVVALLHVMAGVASAHVARAGHAHHDRASAKST